jgi:F420-non-reducing hydrogenase small subunit
MDDIDDQGANMISALASVVAAGELGTDEDEIERKIEAAMDTLADPAGTFYRFNMAHSLLQRVRTELNGHGNGGAQ